MEISEYDMRANISKNEPRTMYPLLINRKFCSAMSQSVNFRMATAGFGSLELTF